MDLPGAQPATPDDKVRQLSAVLRPGACTIVDWALSVAVEDAGDAEGGEAERASAQGTDSEDSGDEGGYASNAPSLPPAIANDPFFAQLLRNAEMREASEQKKKRKQASSRKRRAKEAADDVYDLDDPFIDDSELTVMDSHNYAKAQQSKKRRRKDDGNSTETEAPDAKVAEGAPNETSGPAAGALAGDSELGSASLDDLDRYEEDDYFVYHGPLNEQEASSETDAFEAPAKGSRARGRQGKKDSAKAPAQGRKKANGAAGAKGDSSDAGVRKRPELKVQNRRTISDTVSAGQVPSNGRKGGARTSRKLGPGKQTSAPNATAADSAKPRLPPVPDRDRPAPSDGKGGGGPALPSTRGAAEPTPADGAGSAAVSAAAAAPGKGSGVGSRPHNRRAGTPSAGVPPSSAVAAFDNTQAIARARQPTPEIEAALLELRQAADREDFANRQRFPSSLKPFLRQVCELSMAHALEYDRGVLALDSPENKVFAWSTPLDIVGFTADIYHRLADILPYNRATLRKIVSKLLGQDLLTWKERQLKQIEEGLKARVDGQIESNMGWIPVAARASAKEGEESSAGGSQVRWHWTTLSKHMLYQYMVLTLNINELRNHLGLATGKDGACREQQARKDAYAHLVTLWPGSSMSTYEISRAYSSRKSLLEKQNKKTDSAPAAPQATSDAPATGPPEAEAASSPAPRRTPEPPVVVVATAAAAAEPRLTPATSVGSPGQPLAQMFSDKLSHAATHAASPYAHAEHMSSPSRGDYMHRSPQCAGFGGSPGPHFEPPPPPPRETPAYHNEVGAHFSTPVVPHRNLAYESAGQPPSHYYHGNGQPAQTPQQHHHHQPQYQHHSSTNDDPSDDGYGGPNSGRYSMSVRNLTTP